MGFAKGYMTLGKKGEKRMGQLLRGNFFCLWKNKMFWLCMVFIFGMALIFINYERISVPDTIMLKGGQFLSFLTPVFISFLVGTEYSDGTIRNKIIAGHSRLSVYIANLIVCIAASFVLLFIYTLVILGVAQVFHYKFVMPTQDLFFAVLCCFITTMAYTAIFTLFGMLVGSRGEGLVLSLLILIILFMVGVEITDQIVVHGQKYRIVAEEGSEDASGKMHVTNVEIRENPNYLTGTRRKIYYFLNDFLPSCQIQRLINFPYYSTIDLERYAECPEAIPYVYLEKVTDIQKFPLYAGIIFLLTSISGCFFFCRKEIK